MMRLKMKQQSLLGLLMCFSVLMSAQNTSINLEQALVMARAYNAGLQRDQLKIDQQNTLAQAGLRQEATQIYISSEEFDFGDNTGLHALNVQQNFYLPKANKAQQAWYKTAALKAERQYALTDQALKRAVSEAYYQVLHAQALKVLNAENIALHEDFVARTHRQLTTGETGKVPYTTAKLHLGQARLQAAAAEEQYALALMVFNSYLGANTHYEAEGVLGETKAVVALNTSASPYLQLQQAQQELAKANIAREQAQLIPQLNSGLKLQSNAGVAPLFGYQIGVNVPLFRKAYNKRIEAAQLGVELAQAEYDSQTQALDRAVQALAQQLQEQQSIIEYLQTALKPLAEEQNQLNLAAYIEGELSYLAYLDGLEQMVEVEQQYLAALYKLNALQAELNFLLGN